MLSSELEFCLNEAFQRARDNRHEFMTVEHLLLALLDNPTAAEVLRACGADLARLRGERLRQRLADLGFVAVDRRAVEMPVAGADRLANDPAYHARFRFPCAQTQCGHPIAVWQVKIIHHQSSLRHVSAPDPVCREIPGRSEW